MELESRPLQLAEIDEAYELYRTTFDWLNAHGIRRWLVALPRHALHFALGIEVAIAN